MADLCFFLKKRASKIIFSLSFFLSSAFSFFLEDKNGLVSFLLCRRARLGNFQCQWFRDRRRRTIYPNVSAPTELDHNDDDDDNNNNGRPASHAST